jgi:hypothetical protein
MSVTYLRLIILSVIDGVSINNEVLINLKIKSTQSFRYAYKNSVCKRFKINDGSYTVIQLVNKLK